MRIRYALPIALAMICSVPAKAEDRASKITLESLAFETLSAAHASKPCPHVRTRHALTYTFPTYLIDADGSKDVAEYRIVLMHGRLLRVSQLLPPDHPSNCTMLGFVADSVTGKLDVGAYEHCKNGDELRLEGAFYYDNANKKRIGLEHKLAWDIRFRLLMQRVHEIAAMCSK